MGLIPAFLIFATIYTAIAWRYFAKSKKKKDEDDDEWNGWGNGDKDDDLPPGPFFISPGGSLVSKNKQKKYEYAN